MDGNRNLKIKIDTFFPHEACLNNGNNVNCNFTLVTVFVLTNHSLN